MILYANFGAAITGPGYRFLDATGAWTGSRVTAGIVNPTGGIYQATVTPPVDAVAVVWDDTTGALQAFEPLSLTDPRVANLDASVSSRLAASAYTAPPTAAANRAEMDANSTKLAHMDADISSRLAASAYTAPPTVEQIAAKVAVTDPISRLNVDPPDAPVIVLPGAPADVSLCRVYGYFETLDNQTPPAGIRVVFELQASGPAKSNKMLAGRKVVAAIDGSGRLTDEAGTNAWVDLQRNDLITPDGTVYLVTCEELKLARTPLTLAGETYDLSTLAGA